MTMALPESILVAVDFASGSMRALKTALAWRPPSAEVTVLHVLDSEVAQKAEQAGLGTYAEVMSKLRLRAEEQLASLQAEWDASGVEAMIVEGIPFVEIVKIANDLDCDLVVMGMHRSQPGPTEVLFGSTAEKVLRAARRPVLCVP
jgi:glycine betaine transporter